MKISVAMCTHNGEAFVGQQLMALRWQTKPPYEVVVWDDDSTDRTLDIVGSYADQMPYPVRIVRSTTHRGSTRGYDHAISLCTGEAIALCDQDGLWHLDKLRKLSRVLELEPEVGGVFSDGFLVDDHGQHLQGSLWQRRRFTLRQQTAFNRNSALNILLQKNVVTGSTLLFRYRLIKHLTPIAQEWWHDAWIAVLIAAQSRLVAAPDQLASYRVHATRQGGMAVSRWQGTSQPDSNQTVAIQDLISLRWSLMAAKVASLQVEPAYVRLVEAKVRFLKARSTLREQRTLGRFVGATAALPGYLRFSSGISTYLRDISSSTGLDWDAMTEMGAASPW